MFVKNLVIICHILSFVIWGIYIIKSSGYENVNKKGKQYIIFLGIINFISAILLIFLYYVYPNIYYDEILYFFIIVISVLIALIELFVYQYVAKKCYAAKSETLVRENVDLNEEQWKDQEIINFCITNSKRIEKVKDTILFMLPGYYVTDLDGYICCEKNGKKQYIGHTGKYSIISDFFVRKGYQTFRYDVEYGRSRYRIPDNELFSIINDNMGKKGITNLILFCPGYANEFIEQMVEIYNPKAVISFGMMNEKQMEKLERVNLSIPVYMAAFGDDPFCEIKRFDEKVHKFDNTDYTFCVKGKKRITKKGRTMENEGTTDIVPLQSVAEWLENIGRL